jgi:hypothetical protein
MRERRGGLSSSLEESPPLLSRMILMLTEQIKKV